MLWIEDDTLVLVHSDGVVHVCTFIIVECSST